MTIDSFIWEGGPLSYNTVPAEPSPFDEFYYRNCCGQPYERNDAWLKFFGGVADRIVSDIRPARVLDAGCAIGLLVETLRARGVDARGIDLSAWAIEHASEAAAPHVREGSIADPFGERYDLIVCIEVLEHMPPELAEQAIANFAAHTGDVLFSSTPFDYREPTHINVRMPEDWAEAFARHGFYRDVDFDASFVTKWAVRFTRRSLPVHRLVRDYERRFWQLRAAELDARSYAVDMQRKFAEIEKERDRIEPELRDLRLLRADLEADANEARQKLSGALDTIRHMEMSAFWRARLMMRKLLRRD
jgi:cyclopropane fatty-acyl-phospholipid synthase-like methyltransferase